MLRRSARLRKEFLFRKSVEEKDQIVADRKRTLRAALDSGKPLPTEIREDFKRLRTTLDLDDARTAQGPHMAIDDEYAYAGLEDPKILITTSRSPSSRLCQFAKELRLILPNSQRVNRGGYKIDDLVHLSRTNDVSDIVIVHEHKGEPDGFIVSHLPHGPTAYFGLSEVVLRHDLPEKPSNMSERPPHLVFHNFTSKLGERVSNVLKYLFPPSAASTQRVVSFVNYGDLVLFRNFTWKAKAGRNDRPREEDIELEEQGPRFTMRLFRLDLGTIEMKDVQTEWALKSFINKPRAAFHDEDSQAAV